MHGHMDIKKAYKFSLKPSTDISLLSLVHTYISNTLVPLSLSTLAVLLEIASI